MPTSLDEQLFPGAIAMSPSFVLERLQGMNEKYGQEVIQSDGRFKKTREMWTAAVFFLGAHALNGKEYWVAPEYSAQTPDIYGYALDLHETVKNGIHRKVLNIEVTEWEEHCEPDLADTILRKLRGKKYPPYYVLLVLARNPNIKVSLNHVAQRLSQAAAEITVSEIWILARPISEAPGGTYLIVRVFPAFCYRPFDLKEEAVKCANQMELITFEGRGTGGPHLIEEFHAMPLPNL